MVPERVFVVEDDRDIARLVGHHLQAAGYQAELFFSGARLLAQALSNRPSLILLDIMLPGTDGFDLCRQIRQRESLAQVPIIFLTAKSDECDRVKGLELGADDYIVKPFSPRELLARIRAVLRRPCEIPRPVTLSLGDLEVDTSSMIVRVNGQMVPTTLREFRLLEYLAAHPGRVFTREQLLSVVWPAFVSPRSVDVYVRRLREKVEPDPQHPRYLKTLRGIGYQLESPKMTSQQ